MADTVHLWFWPSVPFITRKKVLEPLTVQVVEERNVVLELLPSARFTEAMDRENKSPFCAATPRPRRLPHPLRAAAPRRAGEGEVDAGVVFSKWRWTASDVTLGFVLTTSNRKE